MFLNAAGLKKWWVLNTVIEDVPSNPKETQSGHQVSDDMNFVKEFLERLPKMLSHYCQKDTHKLYLEPVFQSYSDIYREYLKIYDEEGKQKMSRTVFVAEVKECIISVFVL
ncbi:hypothetical protein PoB_007563800 [Plakobranchus ocellatus]|uniref:Uncharacterized protein n=1 Tax=Plakobranchus ocellatus TaxID=259542 RepID=A0AAV4DYG9_9GAST|nr:hypothetical protein PoB_007563800 [Plakobranchus ocellatus]